jgi:hypothetical protein
VRVTIAVSERERPVFKRERERERETTVITCRRYDKPVSYGVFRTCHMTLVCVIPAIPVIPVLSLEASYASSIRHWQ